MAKSGLVKYRVEKRTSVQALGERCLLAGSAAARPAAMARAVKTVESCIFLVSPFEMSSVLGAAKTKTNKWPTSGCAVLGDRRRWKERQSQIVNFQAKS